MRKEILTKDGYAYIYAPDHPYNSMNGYVAFHRLVAEEKLGRLILPDEIVHHIDGNKLNNAPENLVVITRAEHMRAHKASTVYSKEFLHTEYIIKRKTIQQIADENSCVRQTVMKWLKHFNIPLRLKSEELISQIVLLNKLGFSQPQISEQLGVSQMTVSRRLRDANKHSV